ncbi:MAG: YciI family protein [Ilumatobacteraceae bacterium]
MKQYMLSVYATEADMPADVPVETIYADVDAFNDQLRASGAWVFAGGLFPAETATVVRIENGNAVTTDGPFAESKEHLGGFWVVNAPDLDAALQLAEQGSRACRGPVEVRPFADEPES